MAPAILTDHGGEQAAAASGEGHQPTPLGDCVRDVADHESTRRPAAGVLVSYAVKDLLVGHDDTAGVETERLAVAELMARLSRTFESDWQPTDVRHADGKRQARLEGLASSLIIE